jgi:peptide/nickel transport system substrate-binding protein
MIHPRGGRCARGAPGWRAAALVGLATWSACSPKKPPAPPPSELVLRVGIGGLPTQTPERGVQQFISNITQEGLVRYDPDGRLQPALAEKIELSADGLQLTLHLRPKVTFHDGSPVDAAVIVAALKDGLPRVLRSAFDDVEGIEARGDREVVITFKQRSNLVVESLWDVTIQKKGQPSIGTGPFIAPAVSAGQSVEMTANANYYLGRPTISRIVLTAYPNTRAAWADMLRDRLDMLAEVDPEALPSMRDSKLATLYTFERPYQYMLVLNAQSPKLQAAAVRRALNQAFDREALVRDALFGEGSPSAGPVSNLHWAFQEERSTFSFNPKSAAATIAATAAARKSQPLTLTCLTLPGAQYERLALNVKQQLQAIGVRLEIQEVPPDRPAAAVAKHEYEMLLLDALSGPNMFRPYRWWVQNVGFTGRGVVSALGEIRRAATEAQYKAAVGAFQRAAADDPPAVFLAWGKRTRAVVNRFDVEREPNRDIILTLRQWHLKTDNPNATRD